MSNQENLFKMMKFRYEWRDYQAHVLSELDTHLDDDHLHVVAAPGSGKTILGLEVMRKLSQPSLILAPTITIRNQWIDRITSMFMTDQADDPDWISTDIRTPKLVTVITYQALHAAFSGADDAECEAEFAEEEGAASSSQKVHKSDRSAVVELLKQQNVSTVVLDEAHHLRKAWWKALVDLKKALGNTKIVSLTATPPYDVDYKQWQRYEELCGPIDAEISVPELVKCGDLCPHQDYVYFSLPTEKENLKLEQFKSDLLQFLKRLKSSQAFLQIVSAHPWVAHTSDNVEDILSEPKLFSSIIIFLNACGFKPPRSALKVLGVGRSDIPSLDSKWLEVFLTGILYSHADRLSAYEDQLEALRKKLKRIGAIERRKVILDNTNDIKKMLASSLGKLESIVDITRMESKQLGDGLRMVILADYIRKTELPKHADDLRPMNKIGVVPIFEYLRRANIEGIKLGILTGSLIFIPKAAKDLVDDVAHKMGISDGHIRYGDVVYDENYLRVEIKGEQKQKIVHLITEVFNAGGINVLVGTQALLGEGWDAPSVNALILASYVGSYMLSNQMRGRAIRIDPNAPDKVANVWHLVAVDPETVQEKIVYFFTDKTNRQKSFDVFDEVAKDLGHDIWKIRRRFKAFEGLSYKTPIVIESGFKRLGLSKVKWNKRGVDALNERTLLRASARHELPYMWRSALEGASPRPEMREKVEANSAPKGLAFMDTLKYMVMNAFIGGAAYGGSVFHGRADDYREFLGMMIFGLIVAAIYAVPKLFKAFYLWIRNGSIEDSVKQVGWVVVKSLQHMDLIKTNVRNLRVETVKDKTGVVFCRLEGATAVERRYFLEAMKEVLGSVDSPRYLVVRQSYIGRLLQVDYHAVPSVIGQSKKNAQFFIKKWKQYVGEGALIYTRSAEGRATLLQARTRALSSAFRKETDQISVWE